MLDSFGDGWDGAQWSLKRGTATIAGPFTITSGGSSTEEFTLGAAQTCSRRLAAFDGTFSASQVGPGAQTDGTTGNTIVRPVRLLYRQRYAKSFLDVLLQGFFFAATALAIALQQAKTYDFIDPDKFMHPEANPSYQDINLYRHRIMTQSETRDEMCDMRKEWISKAKAILSQDDSFRVSEVTCVFDNPAIQELHDANPTANADAVPHEEATL
jgi:hypothetical protein